VSGMRPPPPSNYSSGYSAPLSAPPQPPPPELAGDGYSRLSAKGTDATGALQTLQGVWHLFDDSGGTRPQGLQSTPHEEGHRAQLHARSNAAAAAAATTTTSSSSSSKSRGGTHGGGTENSSRGAGTGLSTRMVDHVERPEPRRDALDVLEEELEDDDEDDGVDPEDLMRLANRLIAQRQFDAALPYSMKAARRYEKRNGRHDHDTMLAVMLVAKLLRRLAHNEKAIEYFAKLLAIQEKLLGTDHEEVANTASSLGQLYATKGSPGCDLERAAACFQQVLKIRENIDKAQRLALAQDGHVDAKGEALAVEGPGTAGMATALHHLGVVLSDSFRFDGSLAYFMKALKIRRSLGDSAERDTASTLNNMAAVLHQLGRNEQCLAVYGKSLDIKKKLLPPTHPSIADTLYNMGALNLEMNRPEAASDYFMQALTISTTRLGMNHRLTKDLQKQILTCDALAHPHGDAMGNQSVAPRNVHSVLGDELTQRMRMDRGLFFNEYERERSAPGSGGSEKTVIVPPSLTPPNGSGGNTPTLRSGENTPRAMMSQGGLGYSKRSLTGKALAVLATPPMSPLTRFD
jgi:tetratricopeptide (TPR) repeat protein